MQKLTDSLISVMGSENVRCNEPMNRHTTFRIGGPADWFVTPTDEKMLISAIEAIKAAQTDYCVIGNGSNLLVSDKGYRGVIIQLGEKYSTITFEGEFCSVKAGCLLSKLGMQAAARGFGGFEFATGIPGTVGGAVVMNAGAYGGEIKDCIVSARVMDTDGTVSELTKNELMLGYRTSAVMKNNLIVLEARFRFEKSADYDIMEKIKELAVARRTKQPLEYPSAGSTFKRPEGYFAGKLIQDAGLKGYSVGGAQVSEKHSGFVINTGNATVADVLTLVQDVQKKVYEQSGVMLEMEIRKIGEF